MSSAHDSPPLFFPTQAHCAIAWAGCTPAMADCEIPHRLLALNRARAAT